MLSTAQQSAATHCNTKCLQGSGPRGWGAGRQVSSPEAAAARSTSTDGIGTADSVCAAGRTGNRATAQPREHTLVGRPALDGSLCGYRVFNICMRNRELTED